MNSKIGWDPPFLYYLSYLLFVFAIRSYEFIEKLFAVRLYEGRVG
jgi:hypothetical protein